MSSFVTLSGKKVLLRAIQKELRNVVKENPKTEYVLHDVMTRLTKKEFSKYSVRQLSHLWMGQLRLANEHRKNDLPPTEIDRLVFSISNYKNVIVKTVARTKKQLLRDIKKEFRNIFREDPTIRFPLKVALTRLSKNKYSNFSFQGLKSYWTTLFSSAHARRKLGQSPTEVDKLLFSVLEYKNRMMTKEIDAIRFMQAVEREMNVIVKKHPKSYILSKVFLSLTKKKEYSRYNFTQLQQAWRSIGQCAERKLKNGRALPYVDRLYFDITKKCRLSKTDNIFDNSLLSAEDDSLSSSLNSNEAKVDNTTDNIDTNTVFERKKFLEAILREIGIKKAPLTHILTRLTTKEYSSFTVFELRRHYINIGQTARNCLKHKRSLRTENLLYFSLTKMFDRRYKLFRDSILSQCSSSSTISKELEGNVSTIDEKYYFLLI